MKKSMFVLLISSTSLVIPSFPINGMRVDETGRSLIEPNNKIDINNRSLIQALSMNKIDLAKRLIPILSITELGETDCNGATALHLAASKGYEEIVRSLLDKNPNLIDLADKKGNTALHYADEHKHHNIANILSGNDLLIKYTMKLIAEGQEAIKKKEKEIKKHIVMVLGTTGVGKGTLINYLNDVELAPVHLSGGWKLDAKSTLPDISISHSNSKSDTFHAAIYTPKKSSNNIFSYIDTPGFGDTRGEAYDIATAYFRQEVINKADFIKIILMLPYQDFISTIDRGVRINSQIKTLAQFLQLSENRKYITQLKNAISLVVTQVEPPRFSVNGLKNRLEKKRAEAENDMLILMPDAQKRSNFIETKLLKNDIEEYNQALQEVESTSAQRKDVIKSFFNEQLNQADIEKNITNHLILGSNFEIFSTPLGVSSDKAEMVPGEKEKILSLIDKTQYINIKESNIKIGLPISNTSKLVVTNLANYINNKIKEETQNSIPAIIQYCKEQIDRSDNYNSLRKILQSKRDDLIKIINSSDKKNFLKNIKDKLSRELEIEKHIGYLDFFSQLNNSVKYAVDSWSISLHSIKNQIESLLRSPEIELRNNILKVTGVLVSGTNIFSKIKSYETIKELQILALNTIFLDHDFEDSKLKGVNVAVIAPSWKVIGKRIIDISGKNGQAHKFTKAYNGAYVSSPGTDGNHGADGLPGNPGDNGGNFLGIGHSFYNLNQLTINVSGGKGGKGQDGGDGSNGTDGVNGDSNKVIKRDQTVLKTRKELGSADKSGVTWVIHGAKKLGTFNSQFLEIYTSEGTSGGKGGNAGKAGIGGIGGFAGRLQINYKDYKCIDNQGINGENGSAGMAGIGGNNGSNYSGEYVSEEIFAGLRGRGEVDSSATAPALSSGGGAVAQAGIRMAVVTGKEVVAAEAAKKTVIEATRTVTREIATNLLAESAKNGVSISTVAVQEAGKKIVEEIGKKVGTQALLDIGKGATTEIGEELAKIVFEEATKASAVGAQGAKWAFNNVGTSAITANIATEVTKDVTTQVALGTASSIAWSMGSSLMFQAVISGISSCISSGWQKKPAEISMGKAEDGVQPVENNSIGIKYVEKSVIYNHPEYKESRKKYYEEYSKRVPDFVYADFEKHVIY